MASEREAWLGQVVEEPLDPDVPICDPHHHLWDRSARLPSLPYPRYLLEELLQDTGAGHRVTQTVFVQCSSEYRESGPEEMRPLGETDFVEEIAVRSARGESGTAVVAGIVGFADLTLGDAVTPVLEAHMEASQRFRGVRHRTVWDADVGIGPNAAKGLMQDRKFREGLARLGEMGLSFDAWLYHPQLMELVDLARAFPSLPIILDHIGGLLGTGPYAGNREEAVQNWKRGMSELATCPNVTVKVGGLGMEMCGFGWHEKATPPTSTALAEAMGPYYLYCIEQFGVDHCMFESNFPVDKLAYSYTVMWNAFQRMTQGFSQEERAALFQGTAVRVYRL